MSTKSVQDYIKAVYQIREEQGESPVSTTALAARLGVSGASVTGMLKKLAAESPSLVVYEPYTGVLLSPSGEKAALEVIRRHRLIESFLIKTLGYSWDEVHEEAERLEHVISDRMEERMAAFLGNPDLDPHGEPIPGPGGDYHLTSAVRLSSLPLNRWGCIQRVSARSPELLRYLQARGLVPGVTLRLLEAGPFNGPYLVEFRSPPSKTDTLSHEVAGSIYVALTE